jgi:hypothetical protein
MAVPTIQTGRATVYGIGDEATCGFAGILETGKGNHKFKLDAIEDENGSDAALIATNEMIEADFVFVPEEDGDFFATPLSTVETSGFKSALLNGTWIYVGDASIDLSHKAAKVTLKCRRYIGNDELG